MSFKQKNGAQGRTRTGTALTPADFESATSTNFVTWALLVHYIVKSQKNQ